MAILQWDQTTERYFETGVSKGVLYPQVSGAYPKGVAWNGLTGVTESPSGAEPTALWADDIKYLNLMSAEEFGCTIEAYTYPDEFNACNGVGELVAGAEVGQQARQAFGFAYQTRLGNDEKGTDYGYKIHLVYGCMASPSEKSYETINDSPSAITFSWEVSTTPVAVAGFKPTSIITITSTKVAEAELKKLTDVLYGTEDADARLPLPEEVKTLLTA